MSYIRRANRSTGGGWENAIHDAADCSFIGSGYQNTIDAASGASADFITIGGGTNNAIQAIVTGIVDGSFIGAGTSNAIGASGINNVPNSFIGSGSNNIISESKGAFIGGGYDHLITESDYPFIGGGSGNGLRSDCSGIASGVENGILDSATYFTMCSFIGSGNLNLISGATRVSCYSFIGSGYSNIINGSHSFIGSGDSNAIEAIKSFIGGGQDNVIDDDGFTVSCGFIGGGYNNEIKGLRRSSNYSFIGGGLNNQIESEQSGIASGSGNEIIDGVGYITSSSFIGGGNVNKISGAGKNTACSFIGSGYNNIISAYHCCIGSGDSNVIDAPCSGTLTGVLGKTNWYGQHVHATGTFDPPTAGTVQGSHLVWWKEVSGSSNTPIYLDGVSEEMDIPVGSVYDVSVRVLMKKGGAFLEAMVIEISGLVFRATGGITYISQTSTTTQETLGIAPGWTAVLSITDPSKIALVINPAGDTVKVMAYGHIQEMHDPNWGYIPS